MRPKAYSYVRFSTAEQRHGHSQARQAEMSREYARLHGLDYVEQAYQDLGLSAYHGRNVSDGALGAFLEAVREGVIAKGSFLLVESLDRISRQRPRRAARTLEDIVELGITVVDISDGGRRYNTEILDTDHFAFVMMVLKFIRSHEESERKGDRLAKVYAKKRLRAAAGDNSDGPFTRMLPAWLRWDDAASSYQLIEERARLVREMFAWADQGLGQHAIARRLNERGEAPWGRAEHWHRSYVAKVLRNPAVRGTFIPHRALKTETGKRARQPLDAIENFWPAAVDSEVFERVRARNEATAARGRHAGREVASVVAGVAKCLCGSTVTRIAKGQWIYLGCTRANAHAGCEQPMVRYRSVEDALTRQVAELIDDAPQGATADDLEEEIEALDLTVSLLSDDCRELVDELTQTKSEAIRTALREKEAALEQAKAQLRALRDRSEMLASQHVSRKLERLREALQADPLNLSDANRALKESLDRVVVDPAQSRLVLHWRHSARTTWVWFDSGKHSRMFGEVEKASAR